MRNKLLSLALLATLSAQAEKIDVTQFRLAGPVAVQVPVQLDATNVAGEKYNETALLSTPLTQLLKQSQQVGPATFQQDNLSKAIHVFGFSLQNTRYTTATLSIEGVKNYRAFVDGKKADKDLTLEPGTHQVLIQCLHEATQQENLQVSVDSPDNLITIGTQDKHLYTLTDVLLGKRYSGASISADGQYMTVSYTTTLEGGKTNSQTVLTELATGKQSILSNRVQWMPNSCRYYYQQTTPEGTELITVDPKTGNQQIWAKNLPKGRFQMAPTEDFLIVSVEQEGPKERAEIYQVLEPDDRQPGWRDRNSLAKFDPKTGLLQPLTFGYHDVYCNDISADGTQLLISTRRSRLTQRPTSVSTLALLNLQTLEMTPLVQDDGFLSHGQFSPDGKQVLITGSPEALNGIGKNVKPDQIPNEYDYQLYIMDIASKKITPMTRDFNPAVSSVTWNQGDGMIYFSAENRDYISLYQLNPKSGKIQQLPTSEDLIKGFDMASHAPVGVWYGQGANNSDRLYTLNTKNQKSTLVEDLSAQILADVDLGECQSWNFKNSKGDTIYGRFYLPPHFDANKKYPLIVNYYGGCSPTSRNFESRYPHHAYAALGYVVYVVEPSGATGFGQEFSARHVNTAGKGVAEDIIEGTLQFCKEHPYVNDKKIGCIGASYGGFMTQYLQTQTDIFAAAISHAGISDHTSYWGEGYWGYSYSEVSMAGSYPWTRKDLYVDQSPLFNADKIHTPLLFLHGDADTNVPVGESIQMFTALKLLGRETAFVAVTDQNHHILDYNKRVMWQNTIFAWFAKYLQDDASWWNVIYKPKDL